MPASPPEAFVTRFRSCASIAFVLLCTDGLASQASAQAPATPPSKPAAAKPNELDAFMEKVLKRREVNRQTLEQYVLDESEQFEVLGPARMPVYRQKREFTWYVRDGLHVRSPVRFDGVTVGDSARKEYEDTWVRRERRRLERKDARRQKGDKPDAPEPDPAVTADDPASPAGATPVPTPRFVSEAYFMEFKFEPGNYYLAGREQLDGQPVLRIEYYPKQMFNDNDDDRDASRERRERERKRQQSDRERELEQRIERQMNKTALVTLWVDPVEHQIVKYTFDNVWMDFLPAGWFVKVDDIHASMTMGQPFPGIWLPREMNIHAGVTMAMGSLEAAYARRFSDYKQADVKSLIRIPKAPDKAPDLPPPSPRERYEDDEPSGPFVPELDSSDDDPQAEVISEIRVHGNAYVRDDEVIRLAGISVGQPLPADGLRDIEQRLKASGHFESVEVRKRYRSLESTTDIALILLVHERPGFTSETIDDRPSAWGWARAKSRLMFLPILGYDDGYGFTYGGRVSTIDLLGAGERLSVPLTWGGTRQAALEFERTFTTGPLTRIGSTFGISQRENPHFELDDQRVEWTARAERSFAGLVRTGVDTSQSTVEFGPDERSALDPRRECRARHARRPGVSAQRRPARRGLDRPARPQPRRPDQPVHDRGAGLSRRHPPGRARRPRAVLLRGSHAPRLRAAVPRRRLEPAWIPDRHVRRRPHVRLVGRTARADHLSPQRSQDRPHGVHGRRQGLQRRTVDERRHLASGRRRRGVPHRDHRPHQPRRRARAEGRRHEGASELGVQFLGLGCRRSEIGQSMTISSGRRARVDQVPPIPDP